MPNITALIGAVLGLIALFVSPELGVKLIAVYLLLSGVLRLIAPENASVLPPAPRRAVAKPMIEDEDDLDLEDPDEPGPKMSPADAYRTFTPEEIAPSRRAAKSTKRKVVSEPDQEEDEE